MYTATNHIGSFISIFYASYKHPNNPPLLHCTLQCTTRLHHIHYRTGPVCFNLFIFLIKGWLIWLFRGDSNTHCRRVLTFLHRWRITGWHVLLHCTSEWVRFVKNNYCSFQISLNWKTDSVQEMQTSNFSEQSASQCPFFMEVCIFACVRAL